jgi:hypothetical protein
MCPIGSPETSVFNHLTPSNNLEDRRIQIIRIPTKLGKPLILSIGPKLVTLRSFLVSVIPSCLNLQADVGKTFFHIYQNSSITTVPVI